MTGTSVLTEAMKASISTGLGNLTATVSDVAVLIIPAVVGVIALTCGINYALKKVKSVVSAAE